MLIQSRFAGAVWEPNSKRVKAAVRHRRKRFGTYRSRVINCEAPRLIAVAEAARSLKVLISEESRDFLEDLTTIHREIPI